jgi:hypothetical protein
VKWNTFLATPAHSSQVDEGPLLTVATHENRSDLGSSGAEENAMKINLAKAGVHKSRAPGRRGDYILYGSA